MRSRRRALLVIVVGLALAGAVALAAGKASRADGAAPPDGRGGAMGVAEARTFRPFALYWLGQSFEGLALHAVTRRDDAAGGGPRVRADYVGFVYGDCVAAGDTGCAPPLEVQVWPACERSLGDYRLTPAGDPVPHTPTMMRGVPAAWFEDGLRLELYTGSVTVVVFGVEADRVARAATALGPANELASDRPMLPAPVPGALAGTLACSA